MKKTLLSTLPLLALASTDGEATGKRPAEASVLADGTPVEGGANRIEDGVATLDQFGESLFTEYLFAFEVTSILLVIAVVGAVVLARKVKRSELVDDPLDPEPVEAQPS